MSAENPTPAKEYKGTITKIDGSGAENTRRIAEVFPTGPGDLKQDSSRKDSPKTGSVGYTGEWGRSTWVPAKDQKLAERRAAAKKPQQG